MRACVRACVCPSLGNRVLLSTAWCHYLACIQGELEQQGKRVNTAQTEGQELRAPEG